MSDLFNQFVFDLQRFATWKVSDMALLPEDQTTVRKGKYYVDFDGESISDVIAGKNLSSAVLVGDVTEITYIDDDDNEVNTGAYLITAETVTDIQIGGKSVTFYTINPDAGIWGEDLKITGLAGAKVILGESNDEDNPVTFAGTFSKDTDTKAAIHVVGNGLDWLNMGKSGTLTVAAADNQGIPIPVNDPDDETNYVIAVDTAGVGFEYKATSSTKAELTILNEPEPADDGSPTPLNITSTGFATTVYLPPKGKKTDNGVIILGNALASETYYVNASGEAYFNVTIGEDVTPETATFNFMGAGDTIEYTSDNVTPGEAEEGQEAPDPVLSFKYNGNKFKSILFPTGGEGACPVRLTQTSGSQFTATLVAPDLDDEEEAAEPDYSVSVIDVGAEAGDTDPTITFTDQGGKVLFDASVKANKNPLLGVELGYTQVQDLDENAEELERTGVTFTNLPEPSSKGVVNDVTINGTAVNVNSTTFGYIMDAEYGNILNLAGANPGGEDVMYGSDAANYDLTVAESGDANLIYPPLTDAPQNIVIGDITYQVEIAADVTTDTVVTEGGVPSSFFVVENGEVTGFVFSDTAATDSIAVQDISQADFTLYTGTPDEMEEIEGFPNISGTGGMRVTQVGDGTNYTLEVSGGTVLKAGEQTIDLSGVAATNWVTVGFDEDGFTTIDLIANADDVPFADDDTEDPAWTVNDKIVVTGVAATDEDEGLTIDGAQVAIGSGNFTYGFETIDDEVTPVITLSATEETVYATGEAAKVIPAGSEGTVTDDNAGVDYKYKTSGDAYFAAADGNITGFIFAAEGDQLTLPTTEDVEFNIGYLTQDEENDQYVLEGFDIAFENPTGTEYTITSGAQTTDDNSVIPFTVSGFGNAVVNVGDGESTLTFADGDEKNAITFDVPVGDTEAVLSGVAAEKGTVQLEGEVLDTIGDDTGFKINNEAVVIYTGSEALTYDADKNALSGLADADTVVDSGSIERIIPTPSAGVEKTTLVFGQGTEAAEYHVLAVAGESEDAPTAYFKMDTESGKPDGFVFMNEGDELDVPAEGADIKLYDEGEDTSIVAPAVTDANGKAIDYVVSKGEENFFVTGLAAGAKVEFEEATVEFVSVSDAGEELGVEFKPATKALVAIVGVDEEGDSVKVTGATGPIDFKEDRDSEDVTTIEITGSSFQYTSNGADAAPSISEVGAGATIKQIAGASAVETAADNSNGDFTFATEGTSGSFTGYSTDGFTFETDADTGAVTGVNGIETAGEGVQGAFFTGGASFNFNDEVTELGKASEDEYVFAKGIEGSNLLIGLKDGAEVVTAGGISKFITNGNGQFTIVGDSVAIDDTDTYVSFTATDTDGLKAIDYLDGRATGNFDGVQVNDKEVDVDDPDGEITIVGYSTNDKTGAGEQGISGIEGVDGGATIANVGGASYVETASEGTFTFGGDSFAVTGDDQVKFITNPDEDAAVNAVKEFGDAGQATLEGALNGLYINDDGDENAIDVAGDADGKLTYIANGEDATLGNVGGDEVNVIATAGAKTIEVVAEGKYTFGGLDGKTYEVSGDSTVTFTLDDDNNVVGIAGLEKGGKVTGDFTNLVDVNEGEGNIKVSGDTLVAVENDDLWIKNLSTGGVSIVSAEGMTKAYTDVLNGEDFEITDADGHQYTVSGAGQSVAFLLDGHGHINGVEELGEGIEIYGDLDQLEKGINTKELDVYDPDGDFGVIGSAAGVSAITRLGDGSIVRHAAGASVAFVDTAGEFTFGDDTVTITSNGEVNAAFTISDGVNKISAVDNLNGAIFSADHSLFENGFEINGNNVDITGDEDDMSVYTKDDGSLAMISEVGGESVAVNDAGGASGIQTDKIGSFSFDDGEQKFDTTDDNLEFTLDGNSVSEIDLLNAEVTGNFDGIKVNGKTVDAVDPDGSITLVGKEDMTGIAGIIDVNAGATVNAAGGASYVQSDGEGNYTFTNGEFAVEKDPSVVFELDTAAEDKANVTGITDIDEGTVAGKLNGLNINGAGPINIEGDSDDVFAYGISSVEGTQVELIAGISGTDVQVNNIGNAEYAAVEDGKYTFNAFDKGAYDVLAKDEVIFTDGSIIGLSGLVEGDFSDPWTVNGQNVQVQGNSSIVVSTNDEDSVASLIISDKATVVSAGGASYAIATGDGEYTFPNGTFKIEGATDNLVEFGLDANGNAVAVNELDEGAKLSGPLDQLETVNGKEFDVNDPDGEFSVIGATEGIGGISDISDGTIVNNAGGASFATTDSDGAFTFGKDAITIEGDPVTFALEGTSTVNGIKDLNGYATADHSLFEGGLEVNGKTVDVQGDEDDLIVRGDGSKLDSIGNVGGEDVIVNDAGGASFVFTDKVGSVEFATSQQVFTTEDDPAIIYTLDANGAVSDVDSLNGALTGNFDGVEVNNKEIVVDDADDSITVQGTDTADGISKISGVNAEATIAKVGGASIVETASDGTFNFGGALGGQTFEVEEDQQIQFVMDTAEDAKVTGINELDNGAVTGKLDGLTINGNGPIDVKGDTDGTLSYGALSGVEVLGNVGGQSVAVNNIAGAIAVEVVSDGNYTFANGKAYDLSGGDSSVLFTVEGDAVKAITDLDKGGVVAGDFTEEISVNNQAIQVAGDSYIVVEHDAILLKDISTGATIVSAQDITEAWTEELTADGLEVTDTDGDTFKFAGAGQSVLLTLDGKGNIVGVDNLDEGVTLTGALDKLTQGINGEILDVVDPDGSFGVVGGKSGLSEVVDLGDGATINNIGSASIARTNENGTFTFGGTSISVGEFVEGAEGVAFAMKGGSAVTGVSEVAAGVVNADHSLFENGFTVNGKAIDIEGDEEDLSVYTNEDGTVAIVANVGGDYVSVNDVAGAGDVVTDKTGIFHFSGSSKTFISVDDSSIIFSLDANGKVEGIDGLGGTVISDYSEAMRVNAENEYVQVTGDSYVGVTGDVDKISAVTGVNAGATVVQWGSASKVEAYGTGEYTFIGADNSSQVFTNTGDSYDDELTFETDANQVTGVAGLSKGTINFDNATKALDVNTAQYPNQKLTFDSNDTVNLTVGSVNAYEVNVVAGVTGSVSGLINSTVKATGPVDVNGKDMNIDDYDDSFSVIVKDGTVEKATEVTGGTDENVTQVHVKNGVIETDDLGEFNVGGDRYNFADEDENITMYTDANSLLAAVADLDGSMVDEDGDVDYTVNGNNLKVEDNDTPVTIKGDGSKATGLAGLDKESDLADAPKVTGDLDGVAVTTPGSDGEDDPASFYVGGKGYTLYDDANGIIITGDEITDLTDEASLKVAQEGTYTVNGAVLEADAEDKIIGTDNQSDAYIYDPENLIVRKNTGIEPIEQMVGTTTDFTSTGEWWNKTESTYYQDTVNSGYDFDRPLAIYISNDEAEYVRTTQDLDMRPYLYAKEVHMDQGNQSVEFNNAGGNVAHVESSATGNKAITLGDGGDLVISDETAAIGNSVAVIGGAGNDSIFVRDSAATVVDMSKGGADKLVTFGNAKANVTVTGYDASTDAGIKVDEKRAADITGAIAAAAKGAASPLGFGDGIVSITSAAGDTSQVDVGQTNGGTLVNLYSPYNVKQQVGFTDIDGGTVNAASSTEDVILIGNYQDKKNAGSVLISGSGSDSIYGGGKDSIAPGAGLDLVEMRDDITRAGALIELGKGRTTITGMNNTLAAAAGDTLSFDYGAAKKVEFTGGNLIIDGDGFYGIAQAADSLVGGYTTQFIYDNVGGKLYKAAIGGASSTIYVEEDEDIRADAYLGDYTTVDFRAYTGPATVDLKGDIYDSNIDGVSTFFNEGIVALIAGQGNTIFKGSDANETLVAGKGYASLYGDGGKNMLVGYTDIDKEGQATFFVLGNADGAANTITNFEFVTDDNYSKVDAITTADKIEVDTHNNFVAAVSVSGSDVFFEVANKDDHEISETVIVKDAVGKDMRVGDNIAQVAVDSLVFDKFANYYMASGKNATLTVASDVDKVNIWLDDDDTGYDFEGDIKVIDARANGASAELSGNDADNVIYAGTGNTSLWGGGNGDDLLVGNVGKDSFYYNYGDGNDTVDGAGSGDEVILGDMTLDDVSDISVDSDKVVFTMNDGKRLTVNNGAGVDFKVGNAAGEQEVWALNDSRQFVRK